MLRKPLFGPPNRHLHDIGDNRRINMLIAVVSEGSRQTLPEAPFWGYDLDNPGRHETTVDKAVADNPDIRLVPVPAQVGQGIRIHPGYLTKIPPIPKPGF
jgi:hypothetical protein